MNQLNLRELDKVRRNQLTELKVHLKNYLLALLSSFKTIGTNKLYRSSNLYKSSTCHPFSLCFICYRSLTSFLYFVHLLFFVSCCSISCPLPPTIAILIFQAIAIILLYVLYLKRIRKEAKRGMEHNLVVLTIN